MDQWARDLERVVLRHMLIVDREFLSGSPNINGAIRKKNGSLHSHIKD